MHRSTFANIYRYIVKGESQRSYIVEGVIINQRLICVEWPTCVRLCILAVTGGCMFGACGDLQTKELFIDILHSDCLVLYQNNKVFVQFSVYSRRSNFNQSVINCLEVIIAGELRRCTAGN